MSSLRADFDELRERTRNGRELGHASFEPIYYLIFSPERILEVKRQNTRLGGKTSSGRLGCSQFFYRRKSMASPHGRSLLAPLLSRGQSVPPGLVTNK